ncbi:MAG: hypothetical protein B5M51_05755 [Anaerolinea sp. 4484_236]|nr:MAG: hypothetical protein B5M51_05755 [Anaerolinea sp. 4484_236]
MLERKRSKKLFSKKKKSCLPIALFVLGLLILSFILIPTTSIEMPAPSGLTLAATRPPTLTPLPPPTFTPLPLPTGVHGGRIIFTCTRGDFNQLCMVNRDGSGLLQITHERVNQYYPAFSPQGEAIIFASTRSKGTFDLYLLVLSTSKLLQLTDEIGNVFSPDFSPDGEKILFINRAGEEPAGLWVMGRNGENLEDEEPPRRLTQGLLGITGSMDWSPDGRYLLLSYTF